MPVDQFPPWSGEYTPEEKWGRDTMETRRIGTVHLEVLLGEKMES